VFRLGGGAAGPGGWGPACACVLSSRLSRGLKLQGLRVCAKHAGEHAPRTRDRVGQWPLVPIRRQFYKSAPARQHPAGLPAGPHRYSQYGPPFALHRPAFRDQGFYRAKRMRKPRCRKDRDQHHERGGRLTADQGKAPEREANGMRASARPAV